MTLRFYFVRHGETDYNRERRVQGGTLDIPLNELGREQAERAARRLSSVNFDQAYCSPLTRARQTAEIILAGQSTEPELRSLADVAEMRFGQFEGQVIAESFRPIYDQWQQGIFDIPVPGGGESIVDVQRRGLQGIDRILQQQNGDDQTILVVTHGRFLQIILAALLPNRSLMNMSDFQHRNTGISILVYENDDFRAERLCCAEHLES